MVITYYGGQFFKVQQGDLTIAYNPIGEPLNEDARVARFGADIALVSMNHAHFNGVSNLSYGEKTPFLVSGPGEYETKGVYIRGLETSTKYGGETLRQNTLYYVSIEGMGLCFLGALDTPQLGEKIYDAIYDVDILFVPVGGGGVLTPAEAHKLSLTFSPKMIIPMHYDAAALKKFISEAGQDAKPQEKLTLKKKDLEGKEGEVAVLKVA